MTIKQRLFFSNILMLVIPVFLGVLVVSGIVLIFLGVTGYDFNRILFDDEYFKHAVEQTSNYGEELTTNGDLELIKKEVKNFNQRYKDFGLSLSVFVGKEEIYPLTASNKNQFIDIVLSQDERHLFVMDNTAVYRENAGEYSIVLVDNNYLRYTGDNYENYRDVLIGLGLLMFLLFIVIIILTNRFLIEFVFNHITGPLDILVYGVHQIRDGQLDYRIEYTGEDEFSAICSDFNEMAQRLLDSVNGKQKDEANRKELIAGISHDLRTPLTSIKAYVEGIEKGVASTPVIQKRYLNIIKEKTNDLEHIVNQLFMFSKLDIGEFPFYLECVELSREVTVIVNSVLEEYKRKSLSIKFKNNTKKSTVLIDRIQLRNAIINILENSVKYKNKELAKLEIICWEAGDEVLLSFSDDGPGVPCEALEHLFDVFYRVDPSRCNPSKGSGLGLAISAKILERLGGSMRAENVMNGGLAIIMSFPKELGGFKLEKNSDS
ncbi:cell wall metabolism sensor histidine kinase WalK [Acetobacterium wieringae]|uniref:sensor histidine kinase n=1 Tax=Acetobacterium wieringae TaxID=52694 RepID=UPI0026EDC737|nr:ATP-binding protein [Acetobacterium wieringae]